MEVDDLQRPWHDGRFEEEFDTSTSVHCTAFMHMISLSFRILLVSKPNDQLFSSSLFMSLRTHMHITSHLEKVGTYMTWWTIFLPEIVKLRSDIDSQHAITRSRHSSHIFITSAPIAHIETDLVQENVKLETTSLHEASKYNGGRMFEPFRTFNLSNWIFYRGRHR